MASNHLLELHFVYMILINFSVFLTFIFLFNHPLKPHE